MNKQKTYDAICTTYFKLVQQAQAMNLPINNIKLFVRKNIHKRIGLRNKLNIGANTIDVVVDDSIFETKDNKGTLLKSDMFLHDPNWEIGVNDNN